MGQKLEEMIRSGETESATKFLQRKHCCVTKLNLDDMIAIHYHRKIDSNQMLCQVLQLLKSLKHLELTKSSACFNDKLMSTLSSLCTLEHLNLSGNELNAFNFRHLDLSNIESLTHLDLSKNQIGDDAACALAPAFRKLMSLTHLNLSDNSIHDDGYCALIQSLQELPSMTHLNMRGNSIIDPNGDNRVVKQLSMVSTRTKYRCWHMGGIRIDATNVTAWIDALRGFASLECLSLHVLYLDRNQESHNSDECKFIAGLSNLVRLEYLDMVGSSDYAQVDKCLVLAPVLTNFLTLQHLHLTFNKINDDGCRQLAPALSQLTSLTHLNLSCNEIGEEGCNALAKALLSMTSLRKLWLADNRIGNDECRELMSAVLSSKSLENWCHDTKYTDHCSTCDQAMIQKLKSTSASHSEYR
jgi:Ran GTPase-activating protein (RanGAP) involved in mRNA processing and transport